MRQICRLRPSSRSCVTHSGVGYSKGNGFAEQAVQAFEGMLRVHKVSLEKRIFEKICGHLVVAWLTEHAADMLNRHYCRKGRTDSLPAIEGEKVRGQHA